MKILDHHFSRREKGEGGFFLCGPSRAWRGLHPGDNCRDPAKLAVHRLVQACRPKLIQSTMSTSFLRGRPWNFAHVLNICPRRTVNEPDFISIGVLISFLNNENTNLEAVFFDRCTTTLEILSLFSNTAVEEYMSGELRPERPSFPYTQQNRR